jgi:hypothetical protein
MEVEDIRKSAALTSGNINKANIQRTYAIGVKVE